MSIYDYDPDTGLPRPPARPDPASDEQVTAQRVKAARSRYNCLHVRAALRERYPALSAACERAVRRPL